MLSNTCPSSYNSARSLAQMVDWFALSTAEALPDDVLKSWDGMLGSADVVPSGLEFGGRELMLSRVRSSFRLHLRGWFDLRLGTAEYGPEVVVTLYSQVLWDLGAYEAVLATEALLDGLYGHVPVLLPSRLDLCHDVTGWALPSAPEMADYWQGEKLDGSRPGRALVRRARDHRVIPDRDDARKVGTLYIGAPGAKVQVRVYDKLAEVKRSRKDYYQPEWRRHGWDEEAAVTRVEAQLGRGFLREWRTSDGTGLLSPYDALDQAARMWAYVMSSWCREVVPSETDCNQTRWEMTPAWLVVASATFDDYVAPGGYRKPAHNPSIERLDSLIFGATLSRFGLQGRAPSDGEVLGILGSIMTTQLRRKGKPLVTLVGERRARILASA